MTHNFVFVMNENSVSRKIEFSEIKGLCILVEFLD